MGTFSRLGRAIAPVLQRFRRCISTPPGTPSPEHLTSTGRFLEPLEPRIIADLSLLATEVGDGAKYPDEIQITWTPPGGDHTDSTLVMQNSDGSWAEEGDFMDDYPGPFVGTFVYASDDTTYTFGMVDPGDFPGPAPIEQASVSTPTIINSVSVTGGQITLSWDSGDPSHLFDVDVNGTAISVGSATQYTFSGEADQSYAFNIMDTTTGTTSDEVDAAIGPTAPTITAAQVSDSEVDINWDPAGGQSTSINLFRDTTPDFTPDSSNLLANVMAGSTFADSAPPAGTRYYYKAEGVDDNGFTSDPSAVVGVGHLAAPTNLQASHNSASGDVLLSWTPAPGSVQTLIERSDDSGNSWTPVATVPVNSDDPTSTCTTTDNISGESSAEYRATSEDGLSADGDDDDLADSGTACDPVQTTDISPPAAVSDFQAASNSPRTVDLTWQNNAADQTEVDVMQSSDGTNYDTIATLAADATSYQATDLQPGQTYYFQVVASNDGLQSDDSPVQTVQAEAGVLTITSVSGLVGSKGQTVSGVIAHITDTDPQDVPEDFTVSVNWGDGITNQDAQLVASSSGGFDVVGSHTYTINSTSFTPVITVTGVDGSSASSSSPSTEAISSPTLSGGAVPFHPMQGELFEGIVGEFTDSNPFATAADFTASITWGGAGRAGPFNPTVVGGNGNFQVIGSYIYDTNEQVPFTVGISGNDGSISAGEDVQATPSIIDIMPIVPGDYAGNSYNGVVAKMTDSDVDNADPYTVPSVIWTGGIINTEPSVAFQKVAPGVYNIKLSSPPLHWPIEIAQFQIINGLHIVSTSPMIMAKPAPARGSSAGTLYASGNPGAGYQLPDGGLVGFSSNDPDATADSFTATIHWGDGDVSQGTVASGAGGFTVEGEHTFADVIYPPAGYSFTAGPFWVAIYQHGQEVAALQGGGIEEDNDGHDPGATIQYANSSDGIAPKLNYGQNPAFGSGSNDSGTTGGGDNGGDGGGGSGGGGGGGGGGSGDDGGSIDIWPEPLNVSMGQPVGDLAVIAQFTAPTNEANDSFDASATYLDADGNQQTLPVDVDGNNVEVESDTVINTAGDYDVNLTVSDSDTGDSATAETELVVGDADLIGQNVPALKEQAGTSFTVKVAGVSSSDNDMEASALEATIDWGDGTTSAGTVATGSGPGEFNVTGTHTYASPNDAGSPYQVQTTIDEVSNPNNEAYAVTTIDTSVPTVGVVENGITAEVEASDPNYLTSPNKETFTFTRSDYHGTLTVPLDIGGTAVEGTNYTLNSPNISDDVLTFQPDQSRATVTVVPMDDGIPGWTKTVTVGIDDPANSGSPITYEPDPNNCSATGSIGDSDLSATLGLSGSPTIQGSANGDHNLVPLYLNAPALTAPGQSVTLTVTRLDIIRVWDEGSDGSLSPIIGADPSYTWTYSSSDGVTMVPFELWVGATDGSSAMGDVSFTLTDSDLGSTVGSGESPTATYNSVQSNAGQAVRLFIKAKNDPNHFGNTDDWSGLSQPWIVGQYVDVQAVLSGPVALQEASQFTWTVPGVPLASYSIDGEEAQVSQLSEYGLPEIQFYWAIAPGGQQTEVLQVTDYNAALSSPISASTTFNLTVPSHSFQVASLGNVQPGTDAKGNSTVGLYSAPGVPGTIFATSTPGAGIVFTGKVGGPSGGFWDMVQTLDGGGTLLPLVNFGTDGWELDNTWPYNTVGAFDWPVSGTILQADSDAPEMVLNTRSALVNWTETDIFQYRMYQMYKPPGNRSQYVALSVIDWYTSMYAVHSLSSGWTLPTAQNGQGASTASELASGNVVAPPVYSDVYKNTE